jgi:hypothetical protein
MDITQNNFFKKNKNKNKNTSSMARLINLLYSCIFRTHYENFLACNINLLNTR